MRRLAKVKLWRACGMKIMRPERGDWGGAGGHEFWQVRGIGIERERKRLGK
jgi:hypothetical protein